MRFIPYVSQLVWILSAAAPPLVWAEPPPSLEVIEEHSPPWKSQAKSAESASTSRNAGQTEDNSQATITTVEYPDATVKEYRRRGQLYMLQVIPDNGYPYYLMNEGGKQHAHPPSPNGQESDATVPLWPLFSW